jgi:hypothetical protein
MWGGGSNTVTAHPHIVHIANCKLKGVKAHLYASTSWKRK